MELVFCRQLRRLKTFHAMSPPCSASPRMGLRSARLLRSLDDLWKNEGVSFNLT